MTAALVAGACTTVAATTPAVAAPSGSGSGPVAIQEAPPNPNDGCRQHTIYRPPWYYVLVQVTSPNGAFYVGDYNVYKSDGHGNLIPWGSWEWRC